MVIHMAIAFFMSPFLVHHLGDTMYGLRALMLSLTGYMGLLDVGLRVSVVKHVARLHAQEDQEELNRTLSSALVMFGGIAVLVLIVTLALYVVFPHVFKVSAADLPTARVVLLLSGASLATALVNSVFGGIVLGLQRYDIGHGSGIVILLLRSALIVAFVSQGYGIITIGAIHLIAQVANFVWLVWICCRLQPGLRIAWRLASVRSARTLTGYGLFVMLNSVAMLLLFRSGEIVAGMFLGAASITFYTVAGSLSQYLQNLIGTMTQVLHPYASAKGAKGDDQAVRAAIVVGTKMCLLIGLPATAGVIILGRPFIAAWMGERYAIQAAPLLTVLAIARLFWLAQSASGNVLMGVGNHKALTIANFATGVLSVLGSVLLVRRYGLLGLAMGSAVPMILIQGIVLPLYILRTWAIPPRRYFGEALLRPALGAVPFALALIALKAALAPDTLPEIALTVVAAAPALLASTYLVSFSAAERRRYVQAFYPAFRLSVREGR
jgi:O-antigen/teichoic acid export membrane protein